MKKTAIYVGRFNPFHNGHHAVVSKMLDLHGKENCLMIIGSSNAPFSLRHFFSYNERKQFIQKVFPDIKLVGLPDYHNDKEWLAALDDILKVGGINPTEVTFFGGCQEDIRFFLEDGRDCTILNRFDGTSLKTSATEVRDALIAGRPLDHLVHESILSDMKKLFAEKWEKFKKI
ncbi:MAG: adenylyltransferase/cytidyltransferase family protein [Candidatus Pacebacteria bacterium]|nr:adenylyltransferase/cytidyltransferase family protein [Candidatus Paceibacterota bacterium]